MGLGTPLSRFALVRTGPASSIIWTIHHALYDAWTTGLVLRQVSRAYNDQDEDVDAGPAYNIFVQHVLAQQERV